MQKTVLENTLNVAEAHFSFLMSESEGLTKPNKKLITSIDLKRKEIDRLKKQLKRITKKYGEETYTAFNGVKKNPLKEIKHREMLG